MQKTKILIFYSADSLRQDFLETDSFIRRLNDCYLDRGHYFTTILDDAISDDATRDAEIADCALAFFLTEPGEAAPFSKGAQPSSSGGLPDAYKTALNSYNKTGKPKISVYIKNTGTEKPPLPTTIDHALITNSYSHPDTLKLEILMQLNQLGLDGVDVHLEDGKAWQGSTVLLSLENVEAVSGYENL